MESRDLSQRLHRCRETLGWPYLKEGHRLVEAGRHDDLSDGMELHGGQSVQRRPRAVSMKTLLHLRTDGNAQTNENG